MIVRTNLINRIVDSPGTNWVFEAGAGFGKTVLIEQVRSALVDPLLVVRGPVGATDLAAFLTAASDAAHRVGRPALAESVGAAETPRGAAVSLGEQRCSMAVDDLHLWDAEVAAFVLQLAEEAKDVQGECRMFVLTRRLPDAMRPHGTNPWWSAIGAHELTFDHADVAEKLGALGIADPTLASVLHERTGGWPIAVASAAARMQRGEDPADLLRQLGQHNSIVEGLLHDSIAQLSAADLSAASFLATLPFFDDRIATMVGSVGLLDRLAGAGLPITRQTDGWSSMAEVFRDPLVDASPPAFHEETVEYLVARGEIHAAINVCIAMGENAQAARVVAGLDYEQEARIDASMLNAAMTAIGETAHVHPRSLLVQAQINASFGLLEMASRTIERTAAAMKRIDPDLADPVHIEVLLELGLFRIYDGRHEEGLEILERCEAAIAPDDDGANRARLLDLRGMASQSEATEEGLQLARVQLTEALEIWRRLQEPRAAAVTAFRLSASVLFRLGRRQEALDLLDSLPSVGRMTLVNKARIGLERSVVMPYVGRAAEVPEVLAETREIAALLGHEWLLMWACWTEIVAASFENDGDRVERLVQEYIDNDWDLENDVAQAGMWAEAVQALTRCGRYSLVSACVERGHRAAGLPHFLEYAEVYFSAHTDAPEAALARVQKLATDRTAEVEKRWTLPLLEGLCHSRMGNAGEASRLLDEARHAAAEMGAPSLPMIAEGAIVRSILEGAPPAPPDTAPDEGQVQILDNLVRISIFESFGVIVNGEEVAVPRGMVSTLVKVLAVQGGRAVIDQVIDPMWPDADLELGRRRLRNVMRRVRQSCGDIIARSGDTIQLAGGVEVDLLRAADAADIVLTGPATVDAVAAAIRLSARELLPDDRYEDWAEAARAEHQQRLIRLYDLQAELAEAEGNVDLAVQVLEAGQQLSSFDKDRARRACALLRSVERSAAAVALAERHQLV